PLIVLAETPCSIKHDRFSPIQNDSVLGMPFDRPSQRHAFDVPPHVRQGLRFQRVAYPGHVLFDDRALVELRSDIVRGGADQLYTAIVSLVIGPRALEAG